MKTAAEEQQFAKLQRSGSEGRTAPDTGSSEQDAPSPPSDGPSTDGTTEASDDPGESFEGPDATPQPPSPQLEQADTSESVSSTSPSSSLEDVASIESVVVLALDVIRLILQDAKYRNQVRNPNSSQAFGYFFLLVFFALTLTSTIGLLWDDMSLP